jgi:hypothetical protein
MHLHANIGLLEQAFLGHRDLAARGLFSRASEDYDFGRDGAEIL